MDRVVIIGSGLAGLSAAYHLKQQGHENYLILEKDLEVGGLSKSFVIDNFTFDYAIHILYSKDKYAEELIKTRLLKDNFDSQIRKSFVYYRGVYTEYPFQAHLYGQHPDVIKECILGLNKARRKDASKPGNFEDWVYATFGSGIGRHFMIPYNRKQWAVALRTMNCEWTCKRVPIPRMEDVLKGALKPPEKKYGPNAHFWYPLKGGMGSLANGFLPYLDKISLNSEVSGIFPATREVEFNGKKLGYGRLISTIPLPKIIRLLADGAPREVRHATDGLEYNAVYAVNIAIDRPNVSGYHWVYFPEDKYIFHRLSFPMNLSPFMAPAGKSSITAEISFSKHRPLKMSRGEMIDAVIAGLLECAIINKSDRILFSDSKCLDPAYVIYKPNHRENVRLIRRFLNKNGIYPCGRFGDWEYLNMDQSILSGRKAAGLSIKQPLGKEKQKDAGGG